MRSRLRRPLSGGRSRHPGEDELIGLLVPGSDVPTAADAAIRVHLSHCESCAERSANLQQFLDGLSAAAQTDVDQQIPPERLATQRTRIARRLRRTIEPARKARIIRFPIIGRPSMARVQRAGGWLAVAAAAGVIVGVTAGQFLHLHPEAPSADPLADSAVLTPAPTSPDSPAPALGEADDEGLFPLEGDDALLTAVDSMLAPRNPELAPIDDITPRVREIALSPW